MAKKRRKKKKSKRVKKRPKKKKSRKKKKKSKKKKTKKKKKKKKKKRKKKKKKKKRKRKKTKKKAKRSVRKSKPKKTRKTKKSSPPAAIINKVRTLLIIAAVTILQRRERMDGLFERIAQLDPQAEDDTDKTLLTAKLTEEVRGYSRDVDSFANIARLFHESMNNTIRRIP